MSDFQRLPNLPLRQRLARHSVTDPETGCILWAGSRTTNGYDQVR
jgi:hypothetical protein